MSSATANRLTIAKSGREKLRSKGQFWTPDWVADFMVAYALRERPAQLLDPAVGAGAFWRAAKRFAQANGFSLELLGRDIDPAVVSQAIESGLSQQDVRGIEIKDFILSPPAQKFEAIVANPPYIRHHRLSAAAKQALGHMAKTAIGRSIDGRAGLHVYFLIQALQSLAVGGRLSFIVSADICEGVFAPLLWRWITANYRLDMVVAFASEATPFPEVDANALIFCICNEPPVEEFRWVKCLRRSAVEDLTRMLSGVTITSNEAMQIHDRSVAEALQSGLSREPNLMGVGRYRLGDFASVMRGIVTGDNDFFFMTEARAAELRIPESLLVKAVGRTRDIEGELFTPTDVVRLENKGRPTCLLNVNGWAIAHLPPAVRQYLQEGERRGLPTKTLIRTRNPWYRMEVRKVPPIMFAYLGRRRARFIRNLAGVVPLTCLLCVYPARDDSDFIERLWQVLSHARTVDNLRMVGKSYGGDAIKVEPRALEALPLPDDLVIAHGLDLHEPQKQQSFEFSASAV